MKKSLTNIVKSLIGIVVAAICILSAAETKAQSGYTAEEIQWHVCTAFKYPNISINSEKDFTQMTSKEYIEQAWCCFEAKPWDEDYYIRFENGSTQPFGRATYYVSSVVIGEGLFRYIYYEAKLNDKKDVEPFYNLTVNELKRAGGTILGPDPDSRIDQQITFPELYPNILIRITKRPYDVELAIRIRNK